MFIVLAIALSAISAQAQNAKQDANGNYVAVTAAKAEGKPTGKTFTDSKGVKYPLLITAKGKLYYMRTSKKTGKPYKAYLKLES